MYRRDVLKSLVTLPFISALSGCEEKRNDKEHHDIVEIHLDGAFAVVIQENKANSILAFSPRPKREEDQHLFYLNGARKPEDQGKTYQFKMSPEGFKRGGKPEINAGLNDFYFTTKRWRVGDSLVTIELPAPEEITFTGHRSPVTFLSDHRKAWMPTNHVLKYRTQDARRLKLECSDSSLKCVPSEDSYSGVTRFFFEVGPKHLSDYSQEHAHAINYFNYLLHQSFPDLEEKYSLAPDYPAGEKHTWLAPRVVPASFQVPPHPVRQKRVSYIVDCEYTGPLATTNTAPLNP